MAPQNPSPQIQKNPSGPSGAGQAQDRKRGGWGAPNGRSDSKSGPGNKVQNPPAANVNNANNANNANKANRKKSNAPVP